jgi:hypothetical protein
MSIEVTAHRGKPRTRVVQQDYIVHTHGHSSAVSQKKFLPKYGHLATHVIINCLDTFDIIGASKRANTSCCK